MFQRFIRLVFLTAFFLPACIASAADCPDTSPKITGPDVVGASMNPVPYNTPLVSGHTYSWVVTSLPGGSVVGMSSSNILSQVWATPGDYKIELSEGILGNNTCLSVATPMFVTVKPMLAAYFYYEFDQDHGCYYNKVTFTATGDGLYPPQDPGITYEWRWRVYNPQGPWQTAGIVPLTGPIVDIDFPATSGITYEVNHKVSKTILGRVWTDEITDFVYVDPDKYKPVVVLATPTTPGCLNQAFNFSAVGSLPTTLVTSETFKYVDWDFGDGTFAHYELINGVPPQLTTSHVYASPANGLVVTVTLTNTINCVASKSIIIDVPNTIPVAAFTYAQTCVNFPAPFTDNSLASIGNITDWWWSWGDGSAVEHYSTGNLPPNPVTHVFTDLLPHIVTLKVRNSNGCENTTTPVTVLAQPSPMADFTYPNVTCTGDYVQFNSDVSSPLTGTPIASYDWNFGDPASPNNITSGPNPTHLFSGPGNYIVSLTVTNQAGCSNTKILSVNNPLVVNPHPDIDFTIVQGITVYQQIFTSLINPLQNVGNNVFWAFGDGTTGFGSPITHTYPGPGFYTATCTAIDVVTGCSAVSEHSIMLGAPPSSCFTANPPNQCQNAPILFIPCPPGGLISTEDWDFGDGATAQFVPPNVPANPNHIYASAGNYLVTRVLNLGTPLQASFSLWVTIFEAPTAHFIWFSDPAFLHQGMACDGQEVYFSDQSYSNSTPAGNIYQWFWDFGDPLSGPNNTSTVQNPSHIFTPVSLGGQASYNVTLRVKENLQDCESPAKVIPVPINPPIPVAFTFNNNVCLDQTVNFTTNAAVLPPADYTWFWDFGDGINSITPGAVSHLYASVGDYAATLTLTDINGCSKSKVHIVSIIPKPIANFSFTSPSCFGTSIQFTSLSYVPLPYNDVIVGWDWDFGDGNTSTGNPNPSHTYTTFSATGYNVVLTVTTNRGCTKSKTINVQQIAAPVAGFEVAAGTYSCITPQTIQFNDLSQTNGGGNITYWSWDFGDLGSGSSNFSTAQNPSHSYATAGIKTVKLTVTNSNGCSNEIAQNVTINELPVANFTNSAACEGKDMQFTDASSTTAGSIIVSYNWDFGDGVTSLLQSPIHAFTAYGIHNVKLTIVNSNGCIHSVTKPVTVSPNPVAAFTFSAASCVGNPVSFTDMSFIPAGFTESIQSWEWDFGDGSVTPPIVFPNNPNMTYTFLGTATTHIVRLTVTTANGCKAFVEKTVNSIPSPIANYSYSNTTCLGQSVQFTDLSQTNGGGGLQTWVWDFGDPLSGANNLSTLQNPVHTFTATNSFQVKLTITSNNGCVSTFEGPVVINALPTANFTNTEACEGSPTTFTDASTTPLLTSIISYSWNFGDGSTSLSQSPQHTYATYGTYIVGLTVVNSNGCIHTISKPVVVYPKPVAEFSYSAASCVGNPVTFTNLSFVPAGFSSYIQTWQWDFGDGSVTPPINFPNNPNITYTFLGTATSHVVRLTVTTTNGCISYIEKTVNSIPSPVANYSYSNTNCEGQSVQFTDQSQTNGGGSIQTWVWDFGDPLSGTNNISSLQNPSHSFTSANSFQVKLTVTSTSGCVNMFEGPVIVNGLPTANFTNTDACEGNPTTFTDASATPPGTSIISYAWDFGDGATGSAQNPQHSYAAFGNYVVKLTIVNSNGCMHVITKPIIVNPKPVADFSFSATSCVGNPVNYFNQSFVPTGFSSSIQTWQWDFGDGSTIAPITFPNNPNITHTFVGTATSHIVRLTVTTTTGCVNYMEKTVNSVPAPVANFSTSDILCDNQPVQFNDLSQTNGGGSIQTWNWNFGDPASGLNNNATVPNPVHQFTLPASYNITLIVTNGNGCKDTLLPLPVVVIGARPLANFKADTVCQGSLTTFTDLTTPAGTITIYAWDFGDGQNGSGGNPTHLYANPGNFNVKLTVTSAQGCLKDTTKQILVLGKPVASFSASTPTCAGDSLQFTDLSSTPHGSITSWIWDFGDGAIVGPILFPANPNIKHKYLNGGSYNVKLTIVTSDGCPAEKISPVQVEARPLANFIFGSAPCVLTPMQFTDQSQINGGTPITGWQWNFGDPASGANNLSSAQNPTHAFTAGGTYTVRLMVTNANGCNDSVVGGKTVTVSDAPVAQFSADTACMSNTTQFTDASTTTAGTIISWAWNFGDPASGVNNTSAIQNPAHIYNAQGTYTVTLQVANSNQCLKDTSMQIAVLGKPDAAFSYASPNCAGDSIQFTDMSTTPNGTISSWTWDFGDGTIVGPILFPNNPSIKHLYVNGGAFNVTLTIETTNGCTAEKITPVQVGFSPLANFIYGTAGCALAPLQFTDQSQLNGGPPLTQWLWNFGDPASGVNNTSTTQNPTHAFSAGGSFIVRLMVTNANGCNDSVAGGKTVVVNDAPVAIFSADTACMASPTQFTDASTTSSGTIIAWLWNFGDLASGGNNTSTLQNPTHSYNTQGSFTVTLQVTNSNQCLKDTSMLIAVNSKPTSMFQYAAACVNDGTLFTDMSVAPGSAIKSWSWDFDDGSFAAIQNPTHIFSTAGTYMVKLVVTNLANCTDSITIPVIARPSPVADFNSAAYYCPAGKVDFQDISTATASAIALREWTFEPGFTSNIANPTHTYAVTNMNYPVTLVVTDTYGCKDTIIQTVFVKPGFSFSYNYDSVCQGYATQFTPENKTPGDSLYSVSWNFGDPASGPNNTSQLYDPMHTFTGPGTYLVKMKAYNSDNCFDSVYHEVIVYKAPEPLFSFISTPCDDNVHFTDSTLVTGSGTIAQWIWKWGDGNTTVINAPGPGNASHLYVNAGLYTVTLIMTSNVGCTDSVTRTVQRFPCITTGFTVNDTLCARNKIEFTDNSLPVTLIDQWKWTWGDGTDTTYTVFGSPVTHTYADSGTYAVKVKIWALVDGTTITDSVMNNVKVYPTPNTYFSNNPVCLNQISLFRDTSKTYGAGISKWDWSFSSNPADISGLKNPTHTYDTAGLYNVQLITTNKYGCKDSLTKTSRIYGLPTAGFAYEAACIGDPTFFFDASVKSDTTFGIWNWSFGDLTTLSDTSHVKNPRYVYPDSLNYSLRMIVKDNYGCIDTVDSIVKVHVTPESAFTATDGFNGKQGQVQLNNASTGAESYLWNFGNDQGSTEENPVAVFTEDGTYTIMLISHNRYNCADTTYYKYELLFKGLYVPNAFSPSGTNLGVRLFKPAGINLRQYQVTVFDIWGHQMWESTQLDANGTPSEGWDGTFEGNLMPQGNYMWKINASFVDGSQWEGSDLGVPGTGTTMGTVTLIR